MRHTLSSAEKNWQLQNKNTETGVKGLKLEAALPVNFREQMSTRNDALQQPAAPLIMQYETQVYKVSCG